jgi:hypothetical protein
MDNEGFAKDLREMSITYDTVDEYVNQFENNIEKLLNTHAPIKEKVQIYRTPKPWFSESIVTLKRVMRRAERLWRLHRQSRDYEIFKCARFKYHSALINEKCRTLSGRVLEAKGDSKKLHRIVKELTGSKSDNPMPPVDNENTLADQFADHFMDKIAKIRDSLKDYENFKPSRKDVPSFDRFAELTENEIEKLISQL